MTIIIIVIPSIALHSYMWFSRPKNALPFYIIHLKKKHSPPIQASFELPSSENLPPNLTLQGHQSPLPGYPSVDSTCVQPLWPDRMECVHLSSWRLVKTHNARPYSPVSDSVGLGAGLKNGYC